MTSSPAVVQPHAMWCLILAACFFRLATAFTVCVVHDPPFAICPTSNYEGFVQDQNSISGFDVDMLRWVLNDAGFSWEPTAGYADPQYMKYAWRCSKTLTWDAVEATTNFGTLSNATWPSSSDPPRATSNAVVLPFPCDIGIGDFTVTSSQARKGSVYIPYYATGAAIITSSAPVPIDKWAFMKPFHWSLWAGFLCFAIIVPATVFFVERLSIEGVLPLNMQGLHDWRMAQYQTFLAIFNLQVYDVMSVAAQINIISFCFMILIVVQTYNAQLGALYVSNTGDAAIQSFSDLHDQVVGVYHGYAAPMQQKYPKIQIVPYLANNTDELLSEGLAAIDSGAVAAFVHDVGTLTPRVSQLPDPCKYRVLTAPLAYKFSYGFVFSNGWSSTQITSQFYVSLLHAQEAFVDIQLQDQYLGTLPACVTGGASSTSSGVTFSQLSGLFLVVGAVTGATLLAGLATMLYRIHQAMHEDDAGGPGQLSTGGSEGVSTMGAPLGAEKGNKSFSRALSKVFVKQTTLVLPKSHSGDIFSASRGSTHVDGASVSRAQSLRSLK